MSEKYRQEFAEGEAEDTGKVVAIGESVTVPFGSFTGCVKTEDQNLLESGSTENKFYCDQDPPRHGGELPPRWSGRLG